MLQTEDLRTFHSDQNPDANLDFSQHSSLETLEENATLSVASCFHSCLFPEFQLTIYDTAISLPLPVPSHPATMSATLPSSDWKVFSQVTLSVLESLKGQQVTICTDIELHCKFCKHDLHFW